MLIHLFQEDFFQDMFNLHKEKVVGKFEIKKLIARKGNVQQHWMKGIGMCQSVFETEFNTVQLREHGGALWMSDVPMEQETNLRALEEAKGDVLECGLGIGMFTYLACRKSGVKSVTIIEKEPDIVKLVYPRIRNSKTKVVISDMLEYLITTKRRFDMIHVDIWADIINYKKMTSVIKVAKKKLKPNGIVVCWLDESLSKVMKEIKKGARVCSNELRIDYEPCLTCGKTIRHDYGGFCMDCADMLGLSEMFLKKQKMVIKK